LEQFALRWFKLQTGLPQTLKNLSDVTHMIVKVLSSDNNIVNVREAYILV